jgi:HK97 family phage major capsid protein
MTRREALAKATLTTPDVGAGLLSPEQGRAFVRKIKDNGGELTRAMRQEVRTSSEGEIDKIATGTRIIRAAAENADDGYRAGATFDSVSYITKKVRLPWEVTEDVFHENIEGDQLEATLTDEFTTQFANDLEDLAVNGDVAAGAGPDQAFLQIDDGIVKQVVTAAVAGRQVDAAAGALGKAQMFDALYAMPNKYVNSGNLRWICAPRRKVAWWESMTDRATAAGDAALLGQGGVLDQPLGIPFLEVPSFPENVVLLADPRNFVRVISWQVRKRKVTGETDADLAARDKRFYVFFVKVDTIIEELDAVVRIFNLGAI